MAEPQFYRLGLGGLWQTTLPCRPTALNDAERLVPLQDDHGCVVWRGVMADLASVPKVAGSYFPWHCPSCLQMRVRHCFDYVIQQNEPLAYWACCLRCLKGFELSHVQHRLEPKIPATV